MDYAYSDLVERSRQWASQAADAGWLGGGALAAFSALETRGPETLFSAAGGVNARPLIVAFLGGTGVGKSSLLNRLAGAAIARAGVERPTSKEVTLYHHRSVNIRQLPAELPIEKIKLAHHADDTQRLVIWIDMPDFDSTEESNKHLVLQWLAHIDILIYVVSPERYRDNKAWRILRAEGGKHAWLFVLNQWDRGHPEQYDDFIRQLQLAGFQNPLVMRTICDGTAQDDDFRQLQTTIVSLATGHTVEQLQRRGLQVKKQQLQSVLRQCLNELGEPSGCRVLTTEWQRRWQDTSALLQQAMAWPLQCMADVYAARQGDLIAQKPAPANAARRDDAELWDEWAQSRFEDSLDEMILLADQLSLPVSAVKQGLYPLRGKAQKIVRTQTELAARAALAKPGNGAQRFFLKLTRIAEVVLPLAAMVWAGYQVLQGYYQSSLTHSQYLGVDFAVHSILLIGLSWLFPYFIQKKIQPSLRHTALQGLKKGLRAAIAQMDTEVAGALRDIERQRNAYAAQAEQLIAQCAVEAPLRAEHNRTLDRMLLPK